MKKILLITILFLLNLPASADDLATNIFIIDSVTTASVAISGTLTSTIASTGILSNALNINYNLSTNQSLNDVRLKALVTYGTSSQQTSAFYSTSSGSTTSASFYLVFGHDTNPPTSASVANCKQATSTSTSNPNAIAYPGTVTINNGGTLSYQANSGEGYFSCEVPTGTTAINMAMTTSPKSGTYDSVTALDEAGFYKVEVYLDNLP